MILSRTLDLKALGLFVVYLAFSQLIGPVANAVNVNVFHISIVDSDLQHWKTLPDFESHLFFRPLHYGAVGALRNPIILWRILPLLTCLAHAYYWWPHSFCFRHRSLTNSLKEIYRSSRHHFSIDLYCHSCRHDYSLMPRFLVWGMAIAMVAANAARWLYIIVTFSGQMHMKAANLLVVERADLLWLFQKGKMMVGTLRP